MGIPLLVPGPSTTQGTSANQRRGHLAQLGRHVGHRRAHRDARDRRRDVEALEVEQLGEQHGVLVGGAGGDGREPPVVGEAARRGGVVLGPDADADALLGAGTVSPSSRA